MLIAWAREGEAIPHIRHCPDTANPNTVALALFRIGAIWAEKLEIMGTNEHPAPTYSRIVSSGTCAICNEPMEQERDGSWSHDIGNDDIDHEAKPMGRTGERDRDRS